MKFSSDIVEKFADLDNIIIHLEDNAKEAERKNTLDKDTMKIYPDEFHFVKYQKSGQWIKAPFSRKTGGKEELMRDLKRLMDSYDPNAIELVIYEGKSDKVRLKNKIQFEESKESPPENSTKKKDTEYFGDNSNLELIRKENEINLLKVQNENRLNDLTRDYESQLREKNTKIEELEEEIEEYEDEMNKAATVLGNNQKEYKELEQKQIDTWWQAPLAAGIKTGLGAFFVSVPEILDGIGMSEEAKKELIEKIKTHVLNGKKELTAGPGGSDATFTEGADEYKNLTPAHAEMLKNLIPFLKQLPEAELNLLGQLIATVVDENKVNSAKAQRVLFIIEELKKQNSTPKPEPPKQSEPEKQPETAATT